MDVLRRDKSVFGRDNIDVKDAAICHRSSFDLMCDGREDPLFDRGRFLDRPDVNDLGKLKKKCRYFREFIVCTSHRCWEKNSIGRFIIA